MTITEHVAKKIIQKLIKGEDYRIEIVTLIDAEFLQYVIYFFKRIVDAKFNNIDITIDWYKKEFLNEYLSAEEIAIHSGLNKKTISNMYKSATRQIVIDASNEHYDYLYSAIQTLVDSEGDLNLTLTIKFKEVSVDLNLSESLIIINTLAVKRAALRGGLWSTAGKRVEGPLMLTLCKLFNVPKINYMIKAENIIDEVQDFVREIDFYLVEGINKYKCEVKLMGKGNPESADAVIARDSKVFVADTLSVTNKAQLDSLHIEWVELRSANGYRRFINVLKNLNIPYEEFSENVDTRLNSVFEQIFTT